MRLYKYKMQLIFYMMTVHKNKSKLFKISVLTGSILLVIMAIFHASGFHFVTQTINESNAKEFLKEIFPVLFILPSVHLLCLASLGFLSLFIQGGIKKILILISVFTMINTGLAFYLNAVLPGFLLAISALCFVISRYKLKT